MSKGEPRKGAFTKAACAMIAVLACAVAVSCGGNSRSCDARSDETAAALAAVDDSAAVNSPHVPEMIRRGLESAADTLDYCDWYVRRIRYSIQVGVPDTASLRWERVTRYLESLEPTPRVNGIMGYLLNAKGSLYQKLHLGPDKAVWAYRSAYLKTMDSDSKHRLPDICANLGDAYVFANDMPHAAMWYRRALFLADSLRLPSENYVSLYMGLGRIYLNLGDYDSALECYKTADASFGLMPLNMQTYFLNNYGNYYYYAGDYAEAWRVFGRLERLLLDNRQGESYEMYLCKLNMADILLNLGRTGEAAKLLDDAYAYFDKLGDDTALYYCRTIGIGLALKAGDIAKVRRILDMEKPMPTIDFNLVNIRHRYLREYFVRKGDYGNAYRVLDENVRRNDSLKHNIANMRAAEIMMRYAQDTLTLHHQMEIQEKDADIRAAHLWLSVGVLFIVALVLLLLFGYTYARKRRLQLHMQMMQAQLANVRSRISPHFIFNVLNNNMAKMGGADAGGLMSLVKLIRANLNMSGKYFVSLKEELDFVRYYVDVERQVLGDGFVFSVDAPADDVLETVMVPSMFVQILVENSIKHGLKNLKGCKRLAVAVRIGDADCTITVTDNGRGFDIRRSSPSSTKTGMKVIRTTINIINNQNKRKIRLGIRNLEADDGSVAGCEVTLVLPLGLKTVYGTTAL